MKRISQRQAIASMLAGAALVAACGGSGGSETDSGVSSPSPGPALSEPVDTPETAATTTEDLDAGVVPTEVVEMAVGGLDAVAAATIQVVAQGTFVDPEFGATEGSGSGSGFIIDESGIAVTNNHVVAGAGLLQVYVPGDDAPRNARILGVSECSDLAVIDIEGEGYPALDWYDGELQPGLDVYLAGYPLGDPEYTLTRGIVSKVSAGGETQWASVDSVLEHDAPGQPGNSGGPLVTADGEVVGIHYAGGGTGTNTDQYFAIDADEAQPIVTSLAGGSDVESLGINGQTVTSDDGSVYGLWVSGVTSGSPADSLALLPGDIVTRLEGVSIGADGTMADYCDVLRTHEASDALAVEVLRYATEEVLSGEFNGTPLETAFSFAQELDETSVEEGAGGTATAGYEYALVSDDTGLLTVSLPTQWSDVDGSAEQTASGSAPTIRASTDLGLYTTTWDVPGVYFAASAELGSVDPNVLLDGLAFDECTSTGREDYADAVFTGLFEAFENCGGTGTQLLNVVAFPSDAAYAVVVSIQVVSDADLEAVDTILRTFNTTEG